MFLFVHPSISWWTLELFPALSSCDSCCCDRGGTCIFETPALPGVHLDLLGPQHLPFAWLAPGDLGTCRGMASSLSCSHGLHTQGVP